GLAEQLVQLRAGEKELPGPGRVVRLVPAVAVLADVRAEQEGFSLLEFAVGVAQIHATFTDGFHFGAKQHHAGLERLEEVIVVSRLAIVGDEDFFFRAGHAPLSYVPGKRTTAPGGWRRTSSRSNRTRRTAIPRAAQISAARSSLSRESSVMPMSSVET